MREFKPILDLDELKQSRQITVHVMTHDGKENLITMYAGEQIKAIKEKLLGEQGAKDLAKYKVILLSSRRILDEHRTVDQEGLIDDDRFLVLPRRKDVSNSFKYTSFSSSKGPDIQTITKATEHLGEEKGTAVNNASSSIAGMFDFFGELKRILVSLTEVASLLQHVNSTEEHYSDMETDECDIHVDPLCLQKLTDMGFTETRSRKALIVNRMCPVQAMDWLLLHGEDEDIDAPFSSDEIAMYASENQPSHRRKRCKGSKKREVVASPRLVALLKEMGFAENEAIMALKYHSNNPERAMEWLLEDDRQIPENPDDGLNPDSPLYLSIMDHPVVQLGMTNPRILHAFEDMLENPNNSGQYINDPEIGPVFLQISRIVQSFSR